MNEGAIFEMKSATFQESVRGFLAGDFSRLAPLFDNHSDASPCLIVQWYEAGLFSREPKALEEAFTCACFNGSITVVEYLLARGVDPNGGMNTGLNAFHWAANRGQLPVVEALIRHKARLETRNAYGGTVLGCVVWSAIHEPKPAHIRIIEVLLEAGARVREADFPTGHDGVDLVLRRYGAGGERLRPS